MLIIKFVISKRELLRKSREKIKKKRKAGRNCRQHQGELPTGFLLKYFMDFYFLDIFISP